MAAKKCQQIVNKSINFIIILEDYKLQSNNLLQPKWQPIFKLFIEAIVNDLNFARCIHNLSQY